MKRLGILLALAACAPPPPVFRPVTVEVPVAEACPSAPVGKPDFALGHVAAADDLFIKARAALEEIDQRRAYEAELESSLSVCR